MSYKWIQLYNNTKVDYLMYLSRTATSGEISTANGASYVPTWNDFPDTQIFLPFTSSLVSSYISGLTSPIIGYIVYRQKIGESRLIKVAETDTNTNSIIDYNVGNQTEYKWYVFPKTVSELGISMVSENLTTCWWDWSVTEITELDTNIYAPGRVWLFNSNLESADIQQNLDQTVYRTYSQFPKASAGASNFKTFGFTCLLGNVSTSDNSYPDTITIKKDWDTLVAKAEPVIVKDRKGNIYYAILQNPSGRFMDDVKIQPTTITVSFTELASVENLQIAEEV